MRSPARTISCRAVAGSALGKGLACMRGIQHHSCPWTCSESAAEHSWTFAPLRMTAPDAVQGSAVDALAQKLQEEERKREQYETALARIASVSAL